MAGENNSDKKGFSGLSDLVSEVSLDDEPQEQTHKAETSSSPSSQTVQPQAAAVSPKSEGRSTGSTQPVKTGSGSSGKWILAGLGVCFVIWLATSGGQNNRKYSPPPTAAPQSYNAPQNKPAPVNRPVTPTPQTIPPNEPQRAELQYTTPPVGTNNLLSVPEIRWCIAGSIAIETLRDLVNTDKGVVEFNKMVQNYNSRCGSYRYNQGSLEQAKRDVESYRSQIVLQITQTARQSGYQQSSSPPSVSPSISPNDTLGKASTQDIKEAQQLLTNLGYAPGPIDGQYGQRTADAVRAFQLKMGISQDARIDQNFISLLRRAVNQQVNQGPPSADSRADLSRLSAPELASIEAVCSNDKYLNGPAAYNKCLNTQLAALNKQGKRPDLSRLSSSERASIEAACSNDKYLNGPAAYNRCLSQQLTILK